MKYLTLNKGYEFVRRCIACVPITSSRILPSSILSLMMLPAHSFYSLTGLALSAGAAQVLAADVTDGAQAPTKTSTNVDVIRTLSLPRMQEKANGRTRIIVGLKIAFTPEGGLSAAAAEQQRNEIAKLQSVVLEKIPSLKQRSENIKRFESTPFMALEVNAAELEVLANLIEIASIEEDRLAAPTFTNELAVPGSKQPWRASSSSH